MKLKIRFPGLLLPFRKQINIKNTVKKALDDKWLGYYGLGLLILFLLVLLSCSARAESKPGEEVRIGQKVPDVTLEHILNYKTGTAKISDFKGKMLILDFWATWCAPCVAMIPKMDSLQDEFKGRVQFVGVAYQQQDELKRFFQKLERNKEASSSIPQAFSDVKLAKLFPHTGLPHYVWIDSSGTVTAITGFEQVNRKNILAALKSSLAPLPTKVDEEKVAYERDKPLFINGNGGNGSGLIIQSLLSAYSPGIGAGWELRDADTLDTWKFTARNQTVRQLYQFAFRDDGYFASNRTIFNVKDSSGLYMKPGVNFKDWRKRNTFCYELIMPHSRRGAAFAKMQHDLDNYFPMYRVSVEKRNVRCLVLIRTSDIDKLKTAGDDYQAEFNSFGCILHNSALDNFVFRLNVIYMQHSALPLIDETGYSGKVDMELETNLSDVTSINKALQAYDLKLVERDATINMLVFKDNINSSPNN